MQAMQAETYMHRMKDMHDVGSSYHRNPSAVDNVLFAGIDVPAVRTHLHRGAPLANGELSKQKVALCFFNSMQLLKLSKLPSS